MDATTANVNSGSKATLEATVMPRLHCFKCSDCDYSTYLSTDYMRHKELHTRNEKYKCSICSFSAKLKHLVTQHEYHSHRNTVVSENVVKRTSEVVFAFIF